MRTRLTSTILLGLLACVPPLARTAHAVCGDGIKQPAEACDASAPGGDAACPGACILPPVIERCTCAVPLGDFRAYAIIGGKQVKLGGSTVIVGGSIAATAADGFLALGKDGALPVTGHVVGDKTKVLSRANLGRLFANDPIVARDANLAGGGPYPFRTPLVFATLPAFASFTAGTEDISVAAGQTRILSPGRYGALTVASGGRLRLRGYTGGAGVGRYDIAALKVAFEGRVSADNAVVVNVRERIGIAGRGYLGPSAGEPLLAGDIQVNVAGAAMKLSRGATVVAQVRVPGGKVGVGASATVIGRIIADRVTVSKRAVVALQGGCGDGQRSIAEECDLSAPNGDAACPGDCIPGDPSGLGRIELGQPGQCRCRCESNADCDDGDKCDGEETCQAGICVPGTPPSCDDGNPCTRDCDPARGCVNEPRPDGSGCSDANLCTTNDTCQGGVCVGGPARNCDDDNSCTTDTCVPATGCKRTPLENGAACTDENACTQGDACIRGTCIGGTAVDCDDANPCTAGSCDPVLGCKQTPLPNGTSCAGASPCTTLDACQQGICTSGASQLCSDANPCTADFCTLNGPIEAPVATCGHSQLPNFTPCGANGKVCFNGVCQ
ncbi:MAG: hypothetical protein KIT14_14280 [bacterium]|nr:hypothetical protein [bacterium]